MKKGQKKYAWGFYGMEWNRTKMDEALTADKA